MALNCNVGGADKTVRLIVGVLLLAVAAFYAVDTVWKVVAGVAGVVAIVTAFAGFCPLYAMLGMNTCKDKSTPGGSAA